jgi:hypothetical protein
MPYMGVGFGLGRNNNRMLVDGFEDPISQDATPQQPGGGQGGSSSKTTTPGKNLPVVISIPGHIVTEEAEGTEAEIVEELFEDLSLFELMDFGRSETVLGQNVVYRPIKNISDIYFTYSPKKILALQGTFDDTRDDSPIRLENYIVDDQITIDPNTGDILVAFENVTDDTVIQIELVSGGEIQDS